jgi:hypothetical protein
MDAEQIVEAIRQLAELVEPGVKHVYTLAVRQQIINGIISLVYLGIFAVLLAIGIKGLIWTARNTERVKDESYVYTNVMRSRVMLYNNDMDPLALYTVFGLITIIFGILALAGIHPTINCLLNPEYRAILDIIGTVTGSK